MGGVSRLYILQKVEDTSLSLSEIYAEDKEVQLPAFSCNPRGQHAKIGKGGRRQSDR